MKQFAGLIYNLDQTNKTNAKLAALQEYFEQAPDEDKIWVLALFSGRRPQRPVNTTLLRTWAAELSGIPQWLFDESYTTVGDLAEAIALLLPEPEQTQDYSLSYWINFQQALREKPEGEKRQLMENAWLQMTGGERFAFNKLMTGGFRLGVSHKMIIKALNHTYDIPEATVAHRMMGNWHPGTHSFQQLILEEDSNEDKSRPYPFFLSYPVDETPENLGNPAGWTAEWKWDGIRFQLVKRGGEIFLWSRGEELVTEKYPELEVLRNIIPDGTVIDGELMPIKDGKVLGFNALQKRIGRKKVFRKLLEQVPVTIFAYDLMEWRGKDYRYEPLEKRRAVLDKLVQEVGSPKLLLSKEVPFDNWVELSELREKSRKYNAEGFMLKRLGSPYRVGRKRGDWWKWKVDPLTIDGVLMYAQRGHGRRSNLYTDYTFGVWLGNELVPFAKAYSGLTDEEFRQLDNWIKRNTRERFGPVRTVEPFYVFEVGFEGIARSNRHKSGISLRFPRMLRWRQDKPKEEANTLNDLYQILKEYEG